MVAVKLRRISHPGNVKRVNQWSLPRRLDVEQTRSSLFRLGFRYF
uniref:Uncharacterized protein n=1 Tax=Arundo donax TaxID=35708 RepID=A0A0A8YVW9_ARUDO